jgi:hypothetical protein
VPGPGVDQLHTHAPLPGADGPGGAAPRRRDAPAYHGRPALLLPARLTHQLYCGAGRHQGHQSPGLGCLLNEEKEIMNLASL